MVKMNLRFDEEVRRQLEEAAKRSLRSLNNEVLYRVKASFERKSDEQTA
jgi:hypothetical protein